MTTRAGAGKATIDLSSVLPFDGFDKERTCAFARAVLLEADGTRACLVSLEVTSLRSDVVLDMRREVADVTGCDQAFVWICVSHSFSFPHVRSLTSLTSDDQLARNACLRKALLDAVREAAQDAVCSLAPARLFATVGQTDVNVNRDVELASGWWLGLNPAGFSDHGLRQLYATDEKGDVIWLAFSADVQSSVLDHSVTSDGQRVVDGDLAGCACRKLEEALPGAVALFVVGCAADQAPCEKAALQVCGDDGKLAMRDAHEEGFSMVERLGKRLSDQALIAVRTNSGREIAVPSIRSFEREVQLPGQVRRDFSKLSPTRSWSFEQGEPVATTVRALALGDVAVVGVEPELTSHMGFELRRIDGLLDVLTMVNGAAKYLPEDDAYDKVTYEAQNSGFARGSAELLASAIQSLVADATGKGLS
ncbi:MAG: hypothetical protein ACOYJL_04215 [Tractidigestivibacter sp.]|uniref:hypothetical protein n=1 Tax=Tractidigestivibacter sp. TaxID=2847320 RepID=UPI003D8D39C5